MKDQQGTITKVGYLSLELNIKSGEMVRIPFSRLYTKVHSLATAEAGVRKHQFIVEIKNNIPVRRFQQQLRTALLTSPWYSQSTDPIIELIDEESIYNRYRVQIISPGEEYSRRVEEDVERYIHQEGWNIDQK